MLCWQHASLRCRPAPHALPRNVQGSVTFSRDVGAFEHNPQRYDVDADWSRRKVLGADGALAPLGPLGGFVLTDDTVGEWGRRWGHNSSAGPICRACLRGAAGYFHWRPLAAGC